MGAEQRPVRSRGQREPRQRGDAGSHRDDTERDKRDPVVRQELTQTAVQSGSEHVCAQQRTAENEGLRSNRDEPTHRSDRDQLSPRRGRLEAAHEDEREDREPEVEKRLGHHERAVRAPRSERCEGRGGQRPTHAGHPPGEQIGRNCSQREGDCIYGLRDRVAVDTGAREGVARTPHQWREDAVPDRDVSSQRRHPVECDTLREPRVDEFVTEHAGQNLDGAERDPHDRSEHHHRGQDHGRRNDRRQITGPARAPGHPRQGTSPGWTAARQCDRRTHHGYPGDDVHDPIRGHLEALLAKPVRDLVRRCPRGHDADEDDRDGDSCPRNLRAGRCDRSSCPADRSASGLHAA